MLDNVFCVSLEKMNKTKNEGEPLKQKFFIDDWLSEPLSKVWLVKGNKIVCCKVSCLQN